MATTFAQLSAFSLADIKDETGVKTPTASTPAVELAEEPVVEGIRSLSVSTDNSLESQDEAITPSGSPRLEDIVVVQNSKRSRGSDFDDETLVKLQSREHSTPPKAPIAVFITPDASSSEPKVPFLANITPPTPPRRPVLTSNQSSGDSPGGVAARRAAAGKLPNKALISLQKMRFDAPSGGAGLNIGPGSPGYEACLEGASPLPGMTFRLALGLDKNGKDASSATPSPVDETENIYATTPTGSNSLGAPTLIRTSSTSSNKRRNKGSPSSPGSIGSTSPEPVKIPPTLRGSKILEKLNLSSPPTLASPLSPGRAGPPSPLIMRTSAFNFSNTGPLTPLTPSHLPGAPNLNSNSGFDWFMPESPSTPLGPSKTAMYLETSISPRQPFFLPTPPSDAGPRPSQSRSHSQMASSPLGERRQSLNPFFTAV
ncbi:hypothetical protein T439DRAFT_320294 [Meredithblackwellia eburnea MCA 4105]